MTSPAAPIRVAIFGAAGRMGRMLIECLTQHPDLVLGAALGRTGTNGNTRLKTSDVLLGANLVATRADYDLLIDFSRPESTMLALDECVSAGKPMVIGTTGFTEVQRQRIEAAARQLPICLSGNFSIGVNLCLALVEQAARVLGPAFDIEVMETHHRHKLDAPSGTALMLGAAAAEGRGVPLSEQAVFGRHGPSGPRPAGAIGFSVVRGGDVVGDHSVLFLGEGERVEIAHKASNRANFAHGALRAAAWLHHQPAGLYSMREVLA